MDNDEQPTHFAWDLLDSAKQVAEKAGIPKPVSPAVALETGPGSLPVGRNTASGPKIPSLVEREPVAASPII